MNIEIDSLKNKIDLMAALQAQVNCLIKKCESMALEIQEMKNDNFLLVLILHFKT